MITHETQSTYVAKNDRYTKISYQRCGRSGVKLPRLSLGLWQNFGETDSYANGRAMLRAAFDRGINHFDLANNYGPPYGSAEATLGKAIQQDFSQYRDELFISSKAGYDMWPGPFGDGGSRKYLVSSCDQSLKRTGLDYFDVFYHHRFDTETPIEESMQALDYIVRSGRALYVGISNYGPEQTLHAIKVLKDLGTPLLVHQPKYNMFDRSIEDGLTDVLQSHGIGSIVFSPLAQGLLSDKYISGIPADSRAARKEAIYLNASDIKSSTIEKIHQLNELALEREQSLAQMAIAWTLNNQAVTSCLIGASKVEQIVDSCNALKNLEFSKAEMDKLNKILAT